MGLIGEIHALQDRPGRGRALSRTALRANPHETQTRALPGAVPHPAVERSQEAVKILEAAPEDPDGRVHYLLGRTYQQLGEPEKSRRAMDEFRSSRDAVKP